jgi:hypothetical protein
LGIPARRRLSGVLKQLLKLPRKVREKWGLAPWHKAVWYNEKRHRHGKASSNPLGNLDNLAATDFVSASYDKVPFHSGELG